MAFPWGPRGGSRTDQKIENFGFYSVLAEFHSGSQKLESGPETTFLTANVPPRSARWPSSAAAARQAQTTPIKMRTLTLARTHRLPGFPCPVERQRTQRHTHCPHGGQWRGAGAAYAKAEAASAYACELTPKPCVRAGRGAPRKCETSVRERERVCRYALNP